MNLTNYLPRKHLIIKELNSRIFFTELLERNIIFWSLRFLLLLFTKPKFVPLILKLLFDFLGQDTAWHSLMTYRCKQSSEIKSGDVSTNQRYFAMVRTQSLTSCLTIFESSEASKSWFSSISTCYHVISWIPRNLWQEVVQLNVGKLQRIFSCYLHVNILEV